MADEWITKQATKYANQDVNQELKGNLEQLKIFARNFINGVREAITEAAKTNAEIKTKRKYSINNIYSAMKKSNILTQNIVTLQFQFEKAFNEFLGREIGLIWRDEKTGELYYGDEITAAQIYKQGTSKRGGRASVNTVDTKNLIKFEDYIKTLGQLGTRIQEHQNYYQSLQAEVTTRWEWNNNPSNKYYHISQTKTNKKGKASQSYPYRNTFYWKENDKWEHSRKINKGHITETYVDLVMSDDSVLTTVPPGTSEDSIRLYWAYMQSHNLNNISGIVEGDVRLAGQEMQQFAVKEGQFSTAAVGPYLTTAFLILNFPELDIEAILKTKNLSQLGRNISKNANILAKTEVNERVRAGIAANANFIEDLGLDLTI